MAARRSRDRGEGSGRSSAEGDAVQARENHEFVSEAEETLERIFTDLSELHEQRHGLAEVEPDLINRIFRSAHSLKGLAGMFGLDAISNLAHHLEDILDGLRLGRISLESPAVGLLDEGVSLLASMMTRLEQGDGEAEAAAAATSGFVERVEAAMHLPKPDCDDELAQLDLDPSLLRALTEYEEHRLRENMRRGRKLAMVDSTFEIAAFEEGLSELSSAVREVGEVVSTLPSPGDAPESQIRFSLLVATDVDAERLRARLEESNTDVRAIGVAGSHSILPPADSANDDLSGPKVPLPDEDAISVETDAAAEPDSPVSSSEPVEAQPLEAPPESAPAVASAEAREIESLRSISDTVRVDIRKLDELMNLVGELVIQRNAIGSVAQKLSAEGQTARLGTELAKSHKLLARKLRELQSGVLDVRMVPMRQIFEKLSRVSRRLRRDLDKDVELVFSGSDTELDKLIVEQLVDPLVHIVRNAFDHAIEPLEERRAAGKPDRATLSIHAFQRGNHVVIEVGDDGRGMDAESILAVASSRGLIRDASAMSRKEILNLVFEPGFSTSEEVSETSGRGVGMDVVRSNLADMGGMVELSSRPGRGTTITITLPITLAIIQALIVRVGEERFAIPLTSVLETLLIEPEQIGCSEGREILNLRGEPLRLKRLGEEFELDAAGRDERQFVVVLGMGEQRLGLLVDRLEGQQDTVIKPIKGPLQQIRGIAGATELGDRGTILVIDVSSIVDDGPRRREAA